MNWIFSNIKKRRSLLLLLIYECKLFIARHPKPVLSDVFFLNESISCSNTSFLQMPSAKKTNKELFLCSKFAKRAKNLSEICSSAALKFDSSSLPGN